VIGKDGAKGKTWWAMCLFHIAPLERRAEPGTCGFRCSASNRGDGSVYDRDDMYVDAGSIYDQASIELMAISQLRVPL
jgi:hypothetical protein